MLCRPLLICARHTFLTRVGLRSFLVMHSEGSHIMHCYPSYYYTLDTHYTIININHLETYWSSVTYHCCYNSKQKNPQVYLALRLRPAAEMLFYFLDALLHLSHVWTRKRWWCQECGF